MTMFKMFLVRRARGLRLVGRLLDVRSFSQTASPPGFLVHEEQDTFFSFEGEKEPEGQAEGDTEGQRVLMMTERLGNNQAELIVLMKRRLMDSQPRHFDFTMKQVLEKLLCLRRREVGAMHHIVFSAEFAHFVKAVAAQMTTYRNLTLCTNFLMVASLIRHNWPSEPNPAFRDPSLLDSVADIMLAELSEQSPEIRALVRLMNASVIHQELSLVEKSARMIIDALVRGDETDQLEEHYFQRIISNFTEPSFCFFDLSSALFRVLLQTDAAGRLQGFAALEQSLVCLLRFSHLADEHHSLLLERFAGRVVELLPTSHYLNGLSELLSCFHLFPATPTFRQLKVLVARHLRQSLSAFKFFEIHDSCNSIARFLFETARHPPADALTTELFDFLLGILRLPWSSQRYEKIFKYFDVLCNELHSLPDVLAEPVFANLVAGTKLLVSLHVVHPILHFLPPDKASAVLRMYSAPENMNPEAFEIYMFLCAYFEVPPLVSCPDLQWRHLFLRKVRVDARTAHLILAQRPSKEAPNRVNFWSLVPFYDSSAEFRLEYFQHFGSKFEIVWEMASLPSGHVWFSVPVLRAFLSVPLTFVGVFNSLAYLFASPSFWLLAESHFREVLSLLEHFLFRLPPRIRAHRHASSLWLLLQSGFVRLTRCNLGLWGSLRVFDRIIDFFHTNKLFFSSFFVHETALHWLPLPRACVNFAELSSAAPGTARAIKALYFSKHAEFQLRLSLDRIFQSAHPNEPDGPESPLRPPRHFLDELRLPSFAGDPLQIIRNPLLLFQQLLVIPPNEQPWHPSVGQLLELVDLTELRRPQHLVRLCGFLNFRFRRSEVPHGAFWTIRRLFAHLSLDLLGRPNVDCALFFDLFRVFYIPQRFLFGTALLEADPAVLVHVFEFSFETGQGADELLGLFPALSEKRPALPFEVPLYACLLALARLPAAEARERVRAILQRHPLQRANSALDEKALSLHEQLWFLGKYLRARHPDLGSLLPAVPFISTFDARRKTRKNLAARVGALRPRLAPASLLSGLPCFVCPDSGRFLFEHLSPEPSQRTPELELHLGLLPELPVEPIRLVSPSSLAGLAVAALRGL